ncbi:hypothetical protein J1N35_008779, partial [Gossypium stocksii]
DQTQFRFYSMASIASKELAANNPGLHTSPDETNKGYLVLQTDILASPWMIQSRLVRDSNALE